MFMGGFSSGGRHSKHVAAVTLQTRLAHAFAAQDYTAVGYLREKCQAADFAPVWTRAVARCVKRPSVTLSVSIEVTRNGMDQRTIGTAEMQDAAHEFYHDLYNTGEHFRRPQRAEICADVWPARHGGLLEPIWAYYRPYWSALAEALMAYMTPCMPPGKT